MIQCLRQPHVRPFTHTLRLENHFSNSFSITDSHYYTAFPESALFVRARCYTRIKICSSEMLFHSHYYTGTDEEAWFLLLQGKPKNSVVQIPTTDKSTGIPTLLELPWRRKQLARTKRWYACTSINRDMPQKTGNISTAVRISKFIMFYSPRSLRGVSWCLF
jgi:hypothetical protein